MELRLHSIEDCPRSLPIWELIVDDLGQPSAARIARALGVGQSTVYQWNKAGSAPRMACLALFWLTRWGRSQIDAKAVNDAAAALGLVGALERERDELRAMVLSLDDDCRQIERLFMDRELRQIGRDSGATADRCHTGTERADSLERARPVPLPLPVLALDWPELAEPLSRLPSERPGSPGARRQSDRSGTDQGRERNAAPRPADPREASTSMPLASSCYHTDASVPHGTHAAAHLLELRQARALRAPAPDGGDD